MEPLHAYVAGMVMGHAAKHGIDLLPIIRDGKYTNRFEVKGVGLPNVRIFISVDEPEQVSETDPEPEVPC